MFEFFSNFLRSKRANVATTFALIAIPATIVLSAGIEVARVSSGKAQLQAAVDATILNVGKTGAVDSAAQNKALELVKSNLATSQLTNLTATLSAQNPNIVLTSTARTPSIFGGVVGKQYYDLSATAAVKTSSQGAEIVFVLDTTASMAQNNRMTNLKSAVNGILSNMLDASGANYNAIKVGIVPFHTQVKTTASTAYTWVDWGTAYNTQDCNTAPYPNQSWWPQCSMGWYAINGMCYSATNRDTCVANRKLFDKPVYKSGNKYYYEVESHSYVPSGTKYNIYKRRVKYWWTDGSCTGYTTDETGTWCNNWSSSDGVSTDTQTTNLNQNNLNIHNAVPSGLTLMNPMFTYSPWLGDGYGTYQAYNWDYTSYNGNQRNASFPITPEAKNRWTGCFIDRQQSYDVSADAPTGSVPASLYPARPCSHEPLQPILELTTDINAAKARVNAMQPTGYTNITIGIQWGMEVLSPTAPMVGGSNWRTQDIAKYMVIITDGDNNSNRFSSNPTDVDARTALACAAAKQKGITLFVVRLEEGNSTLLSQCASQPPYYYNLTSSGNLGAALQNVFTSMNRLRLVN